MTPIPFDLPKRTITPMVAYATGLICEHRPDLADVVRAAVLNEVVTIGCDTAIFDLNRVSFVCEQSQDQIGSFVCDRLCEVISDGVDAPRSFHRLADVLGLIPKYTTTMQVTPPKRYASICNNKKYVIAPTIGDVIQSDLDVPWVVGLGQPGWIWMMADACDAAELFDVYLGLGWNRAWKRATLKGEREALRHLIPIHAHTVSLDAQIRAAWVKIHLDALESTP